MTPRDLSPRADGGSNSGGPAFAHALLGATAAQPATVPHPHPTRWQAPNEGTQQ